MKNSKKISKKFDEWEVLPSSLFDELGIDLYNRLQADLHKKVEAMFLKKIGVEKTNANIDAIKQAYKEVK